jgi:hypothetical protein
MSSSVHHDAQAGRCWRMLLAEASPVGEMYFRDVVSAERYSTVRNVTPKYGAGVEPGMLVSLRQFDLAGIWYPSWSPIEVAVSTRGKD